MEFVIRDRTHQILPEPGEVLLGHLMPEKALPYLIEMLDRYPWDPRHLANLGLCYKHLGNFHAAESLLRDALDLDRMNGHGWEAGIRFNLGLVLEDQGRFDEAENQFERVVRDSSESWHQSYRSWEAMFCYATSLMRRGEFSQAWSYWEKARVKGKTCRLAPGLPVWTGEPLAGKRVLVIREGGYGDVILYLRYLPVLKAFGAEKVGLYAWKNMRGLLGNHPWLDAYHDERVETDDYDYQIPLWSIMAATGVCPLAVETPYIKVEKPERPSGRRIGICWAAGETPNVMKRKYRKVDPGDLEMLRQVDAEWVSLQMGEPVPWWMKNTYHRMVKGWHETAKVIAECDLVIAVDTSIVHLAGAMAKPTWLLLNHSLDWKFSTVNGPVWYRTISILQSNDPVSLRPALAKAIELLLTQPLPTA